MKRNVMAGYGRVKAEGRRGDTGGDTAMSTAGAGLRFKYKNIHILTLFNTMFSICMQ